MATQPAKIYAAMAAILSDCPQIASSSLSLDEIHGKLQSLIAKHKVLCLANSLHHTHNLKTSRGGSALGTTTLDVEFMFWADDDSTVSSRTVGVVSDSEELLSSQALLIAQKQALLQVFGIDVPPTNKTAPATEKAKTAINQTMKNNGLPAVQTADQLPEIEINDDWKVAIADLKKLEEFNLFFEKNQTSLLATDKDSDADKNWKKALLKLFHGMAKSKGFSYDTTARLYIDPQQSAVPA